MGFGWIWCRVLHLVNLGESWYLVPAVSHSIPQCLHCAPKLHHAITASKDLMDSSGTFFAVAKVAGLTDKRGNLPLARQNMVPR